VKRVLSGVSPMVPPEVVAVSVPSVQVTDQLTVASPWVGVAVTLSPIVAGLAIVWVTVQLAAVPDPSQKPFTLAWATDIVAVSAPAVSRPVTTA
jgi:hypothetical protein